MAKRLRVEKGEAPEVLFIGISSAMKDYRIAHSINKGLGISLSRKDSLPVYHEKSKSSSLHAFFICREEVNRRGFELVRNRGDGGLAMPALPQMDYLLLIHGRAPDAEVAGWIDELRKNREILLAQMITPQATEWEGLLTDIELHHTDIQKNMKPNYNTPERPLRNAARNES